MNICPGCYSSFSGWWCDNCDQWPCTCLAASPAEERTRAADQAERDDRLRADLRKGATEPPKWEETS